MTYVTKPGYTATDEAAISAEVPDTEDGVIAYAEAEGTAWQLSLVSSASLGSDVIATRGGSGRWLKISIGSTSSSAPYLWSLAYQVGTGGASSSLSAGNYTVSTRYELDGQGLLSFSGVRFYWPGGVGAKTIKCALWVTSSASLVASVNVAVNAAGLYVGTFASPYSPSGSDVRGAVWASIYETSGSNYPVMTLTKFPPSAPIFALSNGIYKDRSYFIAGDNKPTSVSSSEVYPVDVLL